jgi:hypothetical protein
VLASLALVIRSQTIDPVDLVPLKRREKKKKIRKKKKARRNYKKEV